jgi:hypothetical protein
MAGVIPEHRELVALAAQLCAKCSAAKCEYLVVLLPRVKLEDGKVAQVVDASYGPLASAEDRKDPQAYAQRVMGMFGLALPEDITPEETVVLPDGTTVEAHIATVLGSKH